MGGVLQKPTKYDQQTVSGIICKTQNSFNCCEMWLKASRNHEKIFYKEHATFSDRVILNMDPSIKSLTIQRRFITSGTLVANQTQSFFMYTMQATYVGLFYFWFSVLISVYHTHTLRLLLILFNLNQKTYLHRQLFQPCGPPVVSANKQWKLR